MKPLTALIKPGNNRYTVIKRDYDTQDIVNAVLNADKTAYRDVQNFAVNIPVHDQFEYCRSLYQLLLKHIQFKEDPLGFQGVQMPGQLWTSKQGDCKSFSLFFGACLKSKGIPYSYRFVSFSSLPMWTHVYVIAHTNRGDIICDVVYKRFNEQKKFTFKKDYDMKGLYNVSGIADNPTVLHLPNKDDISHADIEASIIKQRYEIEKNIMAGIGRTERVQEYDRALNVINAFVGAIHSDNIELAESIVEGIGDVGKGKGRGKKILKKVVDTAKKAGKTVLKVVTAPARLAMKGILETSLPKSAPFFLYLFIPDNQVSSFPANVQKKRAKAVKIADFIVNGIGMKREHFMGIARNGIMKRYKKSPENVLSELMKNKKLAGIGVIDDMIEVVIKIIQTIVKITGKKSDISAGKGDEPDPQDFGDITESDKTKLSTGVKTSKDGEKSEGANGDDVPNTDDGLKSTHGLCG